jgi:HEPN domain-containing protein
MRPSIVRRFWRAAEQRFTAAEFLYGSERNLDAVYLAGYAVECSLKALILARTVARQHDSLISRAFRGRRGHDFEDLRAMLRERSVALPIKVAVDLRQVASWSTDLRYEVGRMSNEDAHAFLEAVRRILNWVDKSL